MIKKIKKQKIKFVYRKSRNKRTTALVTLF